VGRVARELIEFYPLGIELPTGGTVQAVAGEAVGLEVHATLAVGRDGDIWSVCHNGFLSHP